jgi:C1A family cysteine protease
MLKDFMPSRLFIYYNARAMENSIAIDSGAMIRDGIKSVNRLGVCTEKEWPYDDTPADPVTGLWLPNARPSMKPTASCYKSALKRRITSYSRVIQEINQLKGCLAEGFPFVFGFAVYESFESDIIAKTGIVNLPLKSETMLGGHAVLAVGYDDNTSRFKVRNSWGANWGQKGYFTIPYSYLIDSNLSDDFWTIRFVTS